MSTYNVKGSSIESKLHYTREHFGEPAEKSLRQHFTGLERPLLDSAWYPFDLYDQLLRAMADRHFRGALNRLEEVGSYSAQRALTTTYKPFAVAKDLPGLIRRLSSLHTMYYDRGKMSLARHDDASLTVELKGAPNYSAADLHVAAGFYAGAARVLGLQGVRTRVSYDDGGASIDLSW